MDFTRFCHSILFLCSEFNGSITSWYRTEKRNKAVGGVANSKHLAGLAVDIVLDEPEQHSGFLETAKKLGLKVIDEGDHLHTAVP